MKELLTFALVSALALACHRRVHATNQFLNQYPPFQRPHMPGPPPPFGAPYPGFIPFHHHGHGMPPPPNPDPIDPSAGPTFKNRDFKCPFMHKLRDRLEKMERFVGNHAVFTNLRTEFQEIKKSVETTNSQLDPVLNLPDTFGSVEQNEKKLEELLQGFRDNVMISNMQLQPVDPQIEDAINQMVNFGSQFTVMTEEQKKTLGSLVDDLSKGKDQIMTHIETITKHYDTLTDALADLPNVFNQLMDKVNHMDENHQEDQIVSGSEEEKKLADIEDHISHIEKMSEHLADEKLNDLKAQHETVVDLHAQQYEKLNNIKVIEDGVNEVQEKKADEAKQMLDQLASKEGLANQSYFKQLKGMLETLSAVTD